VEEILDSHRVRKRLHYLVKWTGEVQPTWEPEENMAEVEAVDTFHARYPPTGTKGMTARSRRNSRICADTVKVRRRGEGQEGSGGDRRGAAGVR